MRDVFGYLDSVPTTVLCHEPLCPRSPERGLTHAWLMFPLGAAPSIF
jgi:hypothetical protein